MLYNQSEILIRLIISALIGGLIGSEREKKGRDAGIRTHTLVSLGATIIALTQLEASNLVIEFGIQHPELSGIVTSDITRLIAQVVSGIGFLGAGTIIINKRSVTGLTTAASIWTVAAIGISIGMGYYFLGISAALLILLVLSIVNRLFKIDKTKLLTIEYQKEDETIEYIKQFFEANEITIVSENYSISYLENGHAVSKVMFTLHIPRTLKTKFIIDEIAPYSSVLKVSTLKVDE